MSQRYEQSLAAGTDEKPESVRSKLVLILNSRED